MTIQKGKSEGLRELGRETIQLDWNTHAVTGLSIPNRFYRPLADILRLGIGTHLYNQGVPLQKKLQICLFGMSFCVCKNFWQKSVQNVSVLASCWLASSQQALASRPANFAGQPVFEHPCLLTLVILSNPLGLAPA